MVLAVLRRACTFASSLRTEHFELKRVRLSLAGVGFAIPSVTASIILRELSGAPGAGGDLEADPVVVSPGVAAEADAFEEAAARARREKEEAKRGRTLLQRMGNLGGEAVGVVKRAARSLFHRKPGRTVLQHIAGDLRALRDAMEGCGFQ
jgi:hypothetical protein